MNEEYKAADDQTIARLRLLDACAVSDAMDQLGLGGRVPLGIASMWPGGKLAGRIMTYRLVPAGTVVNTKHLGTRAIEAASADDVIVVEHRGTADAAGWGGILSLAAQTKGLAGVIVDGACRDVDESAELRFPVFARCAVPLTARGRVVEDAFNIPVDIAGISVSPGDYAIADGSGIVFIPADAVDSVLAAAEKIALKEREMAKRVKEGLPVSEVMGLDYETMLQHRGEV